MSFDKEGFDNLMWKVSIRSLCEDLACEYPKLSSELEVQGAMYLMAGEYGYNLNDADFMKAVRSELSTATIRISKEMIDRTYNFGE